MEIKLCLLKGIIIGERERILKGLVTTQLKRLQLSKALSITY
jgi:hypothetical protein